MFDRLHCVAYKRCTPASSLIRKVRSGAVLSQAELAEKEGIAAGRMSLGGHDKLDPSVKTMLRLLGACGTSIALVPPEGSAFADPVLNGRIVPIHQIFEAVQIPHAFSGPIIDKPVILVGAGSDAPSPERHE